MDAFFASIEQRDKPDFQGKPLAVGGSKERGVVAAASYEARKFGVRSAMSSRVASLKCPELLFAKPRFEVYKEVSQQIQSIFREYTDLVEPLSLDEAFLDVTEHKKGPSSATLIAEEIKARIKEETNLTASAGISVNKFLAKVASDMDKPDGVYIILPDQVMPFIEKLPIEKFYGVGEVTARKMHKVGVSMGKDLQGFSLKQLVAIFGKAGNYFYNISRGIDERPVRADRKRKSVGAERTFESDMFSIDEMEEALESISSRVIERLQKGEHQGRTITLKVKYADFKVVTRSKTLSESVTDLAVVIYTVKHLLSIVQDLELGVRLLGVSVSNLAIDEVEPTQLTLAF